MSRKVYKLTRKWLYWFLLESSRAVWVNVHTGDILIEYTDHTLHEPTQHETNEIIAKVISDEFSGG